jgi:hypothetical protein
METLVVHPKNKSQLAAIKAFMQALNINFEQHNDEQLPEYIMESAHKGIAQANNRETISYATFKTKHFKVG